MAGATVSGHSAQLGLTVGKLPPGGTWITKQVKKLRTALEHATADANNGEITITQAICINVACRAEMTAKLCQKYLNDHAGSMDHAARLGYLRQLTMASEARHKAIASLCLDNIDPMKQLAHMFNARVAAGAARCGVRRGRADTLEPVRSRRPQTGRESVARFLLNNWRT
jgi:hypothetical protein